ncbi:MAG: hypothetical protein ACQEW0_02290 [Pseudomonadota bacterium]
MTSILGSVLTIDIISSLFEKECKTCCKETARNEAETTSKINKEQTNMLRNVLCTGLRHCSQAIWWKNTVIYCLEGSNNPSAHLKNMKCIYCNQSFRVLLVNSKLIEYIFWSGQIAISMGEIKNENVLSVLVLDEHTKARDLLLDRVLNNASINYSDETFSTIASKVNEKCINSPYFRTLAETNTCAILFLLLHEMAHSVGGVVRIRGNVNVEEISKLRCNKWEEEIRTDLAAIILLTEYLARDDYKKYSHNFSAIERAEYFALNSAIFCLESLAILEVITNEGNPIDKSTAAFDYKWSTHPPSWLRVNYVMNSNFRKKDEKRMFNNSNGLLDASATMKSLLSGLFFNYGKL